MSIRRTLSLFLALALLGLTPGMIATPASAAPPQPHVAWSPCYRDSGFPFECGVVQVPLDYSDPGAAAIGIAVIRLPATDPARRIGSLFFNPGGPGDSGFDFLRLAGPILYSDEVRARFDMVGFDPRGIYRSTALRCFGTLDQALTTLAPFAFPTSADEQVVWETAERARVDACDQRGGRIRDHMSTADVARDLDLLRQAVGDAQLSYAGYSYGSYLGVTYANMFPDKVRAIVIDGVLDPIAWATGVGDQGATVPFTVRIGSALGGQVTLDEFFRLCDAGGPSCAFAGDAAQRFAALAARLRAAPIVVAQPDGSVFSFGYADLIANARIAMYSSPAWPSFAEFLAAIEALASPVALGERLQDLHQQLGFLTHHGEVQYANLAEGFPGVSCADTDNPRSYAAWAAAAAASAERDGTFGPIWTWLGSICAAWGGPSASRYAGPFNTWTANPVLVVGNRYDPATRYEGAVTVSQLLPNARLLTLNGWGHTSLFLSQCADSAVSGYLLDGALPPAGTVCQQDAVPFAPQLAAAARAGASARSRVVGALIPEIVRQGVR